MSTGIVSKTGLTGATINGTVYEGTPYDKITSAAAAENLVAVAGGTYSDGQIIMNGDTIIGDTDDKNTVPPTVIANNYAITIDEQNGIPGVGGGAAVKVTGGENTISGMTFSGNTARGIANSKGEFVEDNLGSRGGGAIMVSGGSLYIQDSVFAGNTCSNYGGAIYVKSGALTLKNCFFYDNFSKRAGSAILTQSSDILIEGCTFTSNTSASGIYYSSSSAESGVVKNSVFDNSAFTINKGSLEITGSTFYRCNLGAGAIQFGSSATTLTLNGSTFNGGIRAVRCEASLVIGTQGIVLNGSLEGKYGIWIYNPKNEEYNNANNAECTIKGTVTLMQAGDVICIDNMTKGCSIDGEAFLEGGKAVGKVIDTRYDSAWLVINEKTKGINESEGFQTYEYLNDLFVMRDTEVISGSTIGIVDANAIAGEAWAEKIDGKIYFGKYYTTVEAAAAAEDAVFFNGALYGSESIISIDAGIVDAGAVDGKTFAITVGDKIYYGTGYTTLAAAAKAESRVYYQNEFYETSDKSVAFVSADATPADETAKIIGGTVYVGAQYNSLKTAAGTEKFILVQGGTYKTEGQIVPLAGTTISGSDNATVSGNTLDNTVSANGGSAISNTAGALALSGMTFAQNVSFGGSTAAAFGGAIYNTKNLTIENCTFAENTTLGGGGAIMSDSGGTWSITGSKFIGNKARVGGALLTWKNQLTIDNCDFNSNDASQNGGAIYVQYGSCTVNNSRFDSNTGNGAIYLNVGSVKVTESTFSKNSIGFYISNSATSTSSSSIHNSTFSGNTGNAITIASGASSKYAPTLTIGEVTFDGNGKAIDFYSTIYVDGLITLKTATDTITIRGGSFTAKKEVDGKDVEFTAYNQMVILGGSFLTGDKKLEKVVDANSANWCLNEKPVVDDASKYQLYWGGDNDLYITTADTVLLGSFVSDQISPKGVAYVTVGDTGYLGDVCDLATALKQDNVTVLDQANFDDTVDVAGKTITGIEAVLFGTVKNSGTLTLAGTITINAELDKAGTYAIAAGTAFNNADFSAVNVSVDGNLYQGEAVTIATGVTAIGKYTTGFENLYLTVENGSLILREANVTGDFATFDGTGSNLMTNGEVVTFFADKSGADADNIATTIQGGKVESNLVGGAYAKATDAGFSGATIGNVELLIGGTAEVAAKVYAGGYLYGNAGDAEAAAEAQLKVTEVNISIDGGAVSTNMYGGAHARQFGNAKVDTVNITVTDGSHGRIYAGGWAEKGAESYVTTANVTISGGTVDYLYGGGANADGKTFVGTSNITIENDAVVNTIFMGGRYGYSWVNNVSLTFDGENKELNRLSGVSSAGMDYADATVVELKTNVTANLIDYVDKFVINEGYTLTANNEFYLGDRNNETGATEDFTTFDFITDGDFKDAWEAIAGISDFTNAKFAVNGEGLTTWDGTAAIEIGGYKLTYDAEKKTITLANA